MREAVGSIFAWMESAGDLVAAGSFPWLLGAWAAFTAVAILAFWITSVVFRQPHHQLQRPGRTPLAHPAHDRHDRLQRRLAKVHEAMIAAALEIDGIESDPPPCVLQTSLDDFYVHYELNAHTKAPRRVTVLYSLLHAKLQDSLHRAGIEIASPHLTSVRDGNRVQIGLNAAPTHAVNDIRSDS